MTPESLSANSKLFKVYNSIIMATDNIFFIDQTGQVFSGAMQKKFPTIAGSKQSLSLPGWVASEDFNFFSANAPVYRKSTILKTMPYMMEEYLLEPLDTYHFTITMSGRDKPVSIYATTHNKMQEWMQLLGTINLIPLALYPDILALSYDDEYIHAYVGKDRSLARTGEYTGFCGKGEWFFALLEEEAKKLKKEIRINTSNASLVPANFKNLIIGKNIEWLEILRDAPLPAAGCNLLHSSHAIAENDNSSGFEITPLKGIAFAASFLLLMLLADIANIMSYKVQTNEIHSRSRELYQQMFNQEITNIDQLRNRVLVNLQDVADVSVTGSSTAWTNLRALSNILAECTSCNLLEFNIRSESKRVSLVFESREEKSNMIDILNSEGWRALSWATDPLPTPANFYKVFFTQSGA